MSYFDAVRFWTKFAVTVDSASIEVCIAFDRVISESRRVLISSDSVLLLETMASIESRSS